MLVATHCIDRVLLLADLLYAQCTANKFSGTGPRQCIDAAAAAAAAKDDVDRAWLGISAALPCFDGCCHEAFMLLTRS